MWTLLLSVTLVLQVPESKPQPPSGKSASQAQAKTSGKTAQTKKDKPKVAAATPEQAMKTFMVALFSQDETALRAVTKSTNEIEWLLKGQKLPPDDLKEMKAELDKRPIRILKAGDEVTLSGNQKIKIQARDIGPNKTVAHSEVFPIPCRLEKVDGLWRVDASPIIAARKAADAARKKAQEPGR